MLDEKALKAGRLRRHPRGRPGLRGAAAAGQAHLHAAGRRRRRSGSRWSARASRSTPAASRIKPAQGMWEMKSDMAGAAAVARDHARASPRSSRRSRSPATCRWRRTCRPATAYRPGDVITMYDGKRVEVLNTDAEGRMILADAIARACEDEPDYLFETSTLTGGQVIALGKRIAGVMGYAGAVRAGQGGRRRGRRAGLADAAARRRAQGHGLRRRRHLARSTPAWTGPGTCCRAACSCASSSPRASRGRTSTSPGPAYHSGEPTGYWTKGGTGVPVRTLLDADRRHRRQRLTAERRRGRLGGSGSRPALAAARCSRASAAGSRPARTS